MMIRYSEPVGAWVEKHLPARSKCRIETYRGFVAKLQMSQHEVEIHRVVRTGAIQLGVIGILNFAVAVAFSLLEQWDFSEFSSFCNDNKRFIFCLLANLFMTAMLVPVIRIGRSLGRAFALAIVGTDDDELLCEYAKPRLTSIRPGHEACGYAAAEELSRMFRGKPPRTRFISYEAITDRKSLVTCIPAVHLVEAANDYIAKHACEGPDVDAIARALGVSRRLLSLRYAECEKCSVHDALVSRRLAEVMKLLKKPDLSISEITERCGFPNANYLKRLFKQRTGKTMREWRCRDASSNAQIGTKTQKR